MKPQPINTGYRPTIQLDAVHNSFTLQLPVRKHRSAWAAHSYIACPPIPGREVCTGRVKYYYVDDELCYCDKCNLAVNPDDFRVLQADRLEAEGRVLSPSIDTKIEDQIDTITLESGSAEESLLALRNLQDKLQAAGIVADYLVVKRFADEWEDLLN